MSIEKDVERLHAQAASLGYRLVPEARIKKCFSGLLVAPLGFRVPPEEIDRYVLREISAEIADKLSEFSKFLVARRPAVGLPDHMIEVRCEVEVIVPPAPESVTA